MALSEDNSKTYLRQMDGAELARDFWPAFGSQGLPAALWRKGQSDPWEVRLFAPSALGGPLPVEVPAKVHGIFSGDYVGVVVYLKITVAPDKHFFTSGTVESRDGGLVIVLGSPVFVTTKRSACRYLPSPQERIHLALLGHNLPCFDISSGGFSTQVPRDRIGGFEKGQVYEHVELRYQGKTFAIPKVLVVNVMDVPGRPELVRYAFKFEGLKTRDEEAIWIEVNNSIKRMAHLG